jgi:hypothetical protein
MLNVESSLPSTDRIAVIVINSIASAALTRSISFIPANRMSNEYVVMLVVTAILASKPYLLSPAKGKREASSLNTALNLHKYP